MLSPMDTGLASIVPEYEGGAWGNGTIPLSTVNWTLNVLLPPEGTVSFDGLNATVMPGGSGLAEKSYVAVAAESLYRVSVADGDHWVWVKSSRPKFKVEGVMIPLICAARPRSTLPAPSVQTSYPSVRALSIRRALT